MVFPEILIIYSLVKRNKIVIELRQMKIKKTVMVLGGFILVMSVLFGIYFGNKRQKLIKQETVGSQEKVVVKVGNKENVQEKQTIWKVLSWDWQKSKLKVEKDAKDDCKT